MAPRTVMSPDERVAAVDVRADRSCQPSVSHRVATVHRRPPRGVMARRSRAGHSHATSGGAYFAVLLGLEAAFAADFLPQSSWPTRLGRCLLGGALARRPSSPASSPAGLRRSLLGRGHFVACRLRRVFLAVACSGLGRSLLGAAFGRGLRASPTPSRAPWPGPPSPEPSSRRSSPCRWPCGPCRGAGATFGGGPGRDRRAGSRTGCAAPERRDERRHGAARAGSCRPDGARLGQGARLPDVGLERGPARTSRADVGCAPSAGVRVAGGPGRARRRGSNVPNPVMRHALTPAASAAVISSSTASTALDAAALLQPRAVATPAPGEL